MPLSRLFQGDSSLVCALCTESLMSSAQGHTGNEWKLYLPGLYSLTILKKVLSFVLRISYI